MALIIPTLLPLKMVHKARLLRPASPFLTWQVTLLLYDDKEMTTLMISNKCSTTPHSILYTNRQPGAKAGTDPKTLQYPRQNQRTHTKKV